MVQLRGLCNVSFWAADLEAAKDWYKELLGFEPYFARPGYYEFRIGDTEDEVGLIDASYAPKRATGDGEGAIIYWHVDDVRATFGTLLDSGATEYQPPTERGDSGFITASVVDPFGNILGVMQNPHYVEMTSRPRPKKPLNDSSGQTE